MNEMRYRINRVTKYVAPCTLVIIVINIIVFFIQGLGFNEVVTRSGAICWADIFENGEYYRLFTYFFMHANLEHIFGNMLCLWYVGSIVERKLGSVKYLVSYLSCGIIAGMTSCVFEKLEYMNGSGVISYGIGASGAVFGMMGALLWIVIAERGRAEGVTLQRLMISLALSIYNGFVNTNIDNYAHLGGLVIGFVGTIALYRRKGRATDEG